MGFMLLCMICFSCENLLLEPNNPVGDQPIIDVAGFSKEISSNPVFLNEGGTSCGSGSCEIEIVDL